MENRIPAGEEAAKQFKEIAGRAVELIAELQIMDMETQKLLESEARRLGIEDVVTAYDFTTNEFILNNISDIGEVEQTSDEIATPI